MVNQQRLLNKKLSQMFRMRGMSVRPDAMDTLYSVLKEDEEWEETIQTLLGELQQQKREYSIPSPFDGCVWTFLLCVCGRVRSCRWAR